MYEKKSYSNLIPFHRFYFVIPSPNPNEQFYNFALLFVWLASLVNHKVEKPGQFDDPNAISATIATEIKKLNIPFDFPPGKLKQGHGDAVLYAIQAMVDLVLDTIKFKFQKPAHKVDE